MADNTVSKRIRAFGSSIPAKAHAIKQGFATAFVQTVIERTPKKTGRAASNWIVGIGSRRLDTVPTTGPTAAGALAAALTAIEGAPPGRAINVSNNLPYIGVLNGGSSEQAPAAFIEQAYNTARARVPAIKAEVARRK